MGRESLGRSGNASGRMWTEAYLEEKIVGAESRGRTEDAARADSIAETMVMPFNLLVAQFEGVGCGPCQGNELIGPKCGEYRRCTWLALFRCLWSWWW